jgi:hypothetical protein
VNRIRLAQDRNQWRAQVNTAMNIRVAQKAGISSAEKLLASQERGSVELL